MINIIRISFDAGLFEKSHTITERGDSMKQNQHDRFDDTLLTVKDLRDIFRCRARQANELIHIHGFPAIKIGGKYNISAKALDNWIQNNTGKKIIK